MTPETTALIMIGFQNDYFAPDGILTSVVEESSRINGTLANTMRLLDNVRATPMLLVSAPIIFTRDYSELDEPVGILRHIREVGAFRAGTHGAETIAEIRNLGDRVVEVPGRRGLDAFSNTGLEAVLSRHSVEDVILAGTVTSICIDSTGRSAHDRGYRVSILSDCTSARTNFEQEFYSQQIFPLYAAVLSHRELLANLGLPVSERPTPLAPRRSPSTPSVRSGSA